MRLTARTSRALLVGLVAAATMLFATTLTAAASPPAPHPAAAARHATGHAHGAHAHALRAHPHGQALVARVAGRAPAVASSAHAAAAPARVVHLALEADRRPAATLAAPPAPVVPAGPTSPAAALPVVPVLGSLITLPQEALAGLPGGGAAWGTDAWEVIAAAEGITILALVAALRRRERQGAARRP